MAANYKILFIASLFVVVMALLFLDIEDSVLAGLLVNNADPDWDSVPERYMVKSAVPITLIDTGNEACYVTAERFSRILDHSYFSKSEELARELEFDGGHTLTIPCKLLSVDDPKLHVWYITDESPNHPGSYRYFVAGG